MKLENLEKYRVIYVTDEQEQEIVLYGNSEMEVIANVITFFMSVGKSIDRNSIKVMELKNETKKKSN